MKILFLLLMIQCIPVTFEYEIRCPVLAEWRFRSRNLNCSSSSYVCLFHSHTNRYYETCDGLDYSSSGSKLIFEPFFNKAECSNQRYQPFPFSTDGSSNCVYQKSVCNEEGQFVFKNGISKNDTTCGCNFSAGYTFITKPRHMCYCIPSQEDCSCHKHACKFKEMNCSHVGAAGLNNSCPEIITIPSHEKEMTSPMTNDKNHENKGRQHGIQFICLTTIFVIIICIGVLLYEKQGMGRIEKNQYKNALTFGKEVRRHVRIVVIGEHGAGKSTLVRRLLKQDIDGIDSTDGIEMNNKFQINQKDGKWFFYKESEMENITKRIRQTVDRNPEIALPTKTDSIEEPNNSFIKSERNQNPHRNLEKKDSIAEHVNPSERNSNGQEPITWKHPYKKSEQKEPSSPLNIKEEINTEKIVTEDPIVTDQTYVKKKYTDTIKIYKNKSAEMPQLHDPPREDLTSNITYNVMESDKEIDAIFLKAKNISTKLISEDLIQGDIWDFAGEKDYYVTHQTFLTPNAIYLIVADINKDIKTVDMIEKERYFDSIAGT